MATTVDANEFAKQLIADKCRVLIESAKMLPDKELSIIKQAHAEYANSPTQSNFENIKKLILQTKYVEESIEYKNFNRGTFLVALNLIVNKCKETFPNHTTFFVNTARRLEKMDPDIRSSPKEMLKHYYQCIEDMENPKGDEHYMISYAKSIITKLLYDTVNDMTNIHESTVKIRSSGDVQPRKRLVFNKTPPNLKRYVRPTFSFKCQRPC
ncbi:hypothetical protein CaLGV021 [Clostera anastomosis granulovirus A]|uniref:Ac106 n=1 Tax=Clostera anastomosis granulovirus A TaxID=1986289 RepID=U5KB80_9BBAC|nr:hypothetical protein CaLGV021 [Clostera anastomosis granulovirus Henan]AGQ20280.1 hypothetical protein CaLGV021 [Clostera anastomosis granulovirus Henan]